MSDFFVVVSLYKANLFEMYCDQSFGFQGDAFKHFDGLVECVDDTISMRWIIDWPLGQLIWAKYKGHATYEVSFNIQVVYAKVVA
jgi:hypothetical protein